MLFLVFFQFSSFNIYKFNLPVQIFFDGLIFFYLFVEVRLFLIYGLLFLPDPVLAFVDFAVAVIYFFVMSRFKLNEFFFYFQFFFFSDCFGS